MSPQEAGKVGRTGAHGSKAASCQNAKGKLTSNRNEVAAQIAADYAAFRKRVIVFCNDTRACGSVANEINKLLAPATIALDESQEEMRKSIYEDVGSAEATFDPTGW
jgi:replicative superfamily II helicase